MGAPFFFPLLLFIILLLFCSLLTLVLARVCIQAIYQNLGPLITTFPTEAVSARLLRYYTEMAEEHNDAKFGDSDAIIYCAFSFPGMIFGLLRTLLTHISHAKFSDSGAIIYCAFSFPAMLNCYLLLFFSNATLTCTCTHTIYHIATFITGTHTTLLSPSHKHMHLAFSSAFHPFPSNAY